jgi:hypothetical protein
MMVTTVAVSKLLFWKKNHRPQRMPYAKPSSLTFSFDIELPWKLSSISHDQPLATFFSALAMAGIPAVSKCPSGRRRKDTHLLVPRRRREAAKLLLVTPPRSPPSRSPRRCREAEAPALRWESEKFLISAPPRLCSCSPRRHRVAGKSYSPRRHREAAKLLLAALPRLQQSTLGVILGWWTASTALACAVIAWWQCLLLHNFVGWAKKIDTEMTVIAWWWWLLKVKDAP